MRLNLIGEDENPPMKISDGSIPCCVYDFTYNFPIEQQSIEECEKYGDKYEIALDDICKAWTYQLERAPTTGRLHLQGRCSLKTKAREVNAAQRFHANETTYGSSLTITSAANRNNNFYVLKLDTRASNRCWTDKTYEKRKQLEEPWQIAKYKTLLPFQGTIRISCMTRDERLINVVIDKIGNIGKTILAGKLYCEKIAIYLPYAETYKDIMRMVYDVGGYQAYIFDFPRSLSKKSLGGFYAACEDIKAGRCYDDRNKFRFDLRDAPVLWIFTNKSVKLEHLSIDRWRFWGVNKEKELVQVDHNGDICRPYSRIKKTRTGNIRYMDPKGIVLEFDKEGKKVDHMVVPPPVFPTLVNPAPARRVIPVPVPTPSAGLRVPVPPKS